jgi:hypothetical protein
MTIEDKSVIDFIGTDKESGLVGLLISDHLEWSLDKRNLLKDKVNAYLDFIESGALDENYPDVKGRGVYIELVHHYEPNDHGKQLLTKIKEISAQCGVTFTWSQWVKELH